MRRMDDERSALIHCAKERAVVTWGDANIGTLVFVGPRSAFAKVKVGSRHLSVPVAEIRVTGPPAGTNRSDVSNNLGVADRTGGH